MNLATEMCRQPAGELLTLLLTPGDFADDKPSHGKGLQANDRKSSKQPVAGSNPAGGVEKKSSHSKAFAFGVVDVAETCMGVFTLDDRINDAQA
jgi:hypothetical protein